MSLLALEFPPLTHITVWGAGPAGINKVVAIYLIAMLLIVLLFTLGNKQKLVPTGAQNLAEMAIVCVEDAIVMDTMGEERRKYTTSLVSLFLFIFFTNIFEVVPGFQMP